MLFNGYPRRTNPSSLLEFISGFLENLIQGTYVHCSNEEQVYCFVEGFSGFFWRFPRALHPVACRATN
jgi:hypothetical protein